jgi:hypothetical protein
MFGTEKCLSISVHSQRGLTAATKPEGSRPGRRSLIDGAAGTSPDIWAASGAETADHARAGQNPDGLTRRGDLWRE